MKVGYYHLTAAESRDESSNCELGKKGIFSQRLMYRLSVKTWREVSLDTNESAGHVVILGKLGHVAARLQVNKLSLMIVSCRGSRS